MASSGLHSNGYSLVRRASAGRAGATSGTSTSSAAPSARNCSSPPGSTPPTPWTSPAPSAHDLHALSHVTGGGLAANLARVLPDGVHAVVDRGTWQPPAVFEVVARLGGVPRADLERTLNLGVGMVAVVAPGRADVAVQRLAARGLHAWLLGSVAAGPAPEDSPDVVRGTKGVVGGAVVTTGEHPR